MSRTWIRINGQAELRQNVRRAIKEAGFTQDKAARAAGIRYSHLIGCLGKNSWFTEAEIYAIAKVTKTAACELIGESIFPGDAREPDFDHRPNQPERRPRKGKASTHGRGYRRALCCGCGTLRRVSIESNDDLVAGASWTTIGGRYIGKYDCEVCGDSTTHAVLRNGDPDELERSLDKPSPQQIAANDRDSLLTRLAGFNVDVRFRRMASRKHRIKNGAPIVGFWYDESKAQWCIEINPDAPASIQLNMLEHAWEVISTDEKDYWNNGELGDPSEGAWTYASDQQWDRAIDDLSEEILRATATEKLKLIVGIQDDIAASADERRADA